MRRLEGAEPLRLELWHAEDRGAKLRAPQHPIVAAALVEYQPGGVAMGSVPVVAGQRHEPAGVAILRTWLTSLPQRGCRVLQILAEEPLPLHRQILRHAGFPRLTSLLFMAWEAPGPISTLPIPEESPAEDFVIEPFGDQAEMWRRLEHVVEQTYQASLDCPEISGLRSVSDTLTGYRLSAPWKPQLWFLLRQGAQDVGCLLLADRAREETLELVYMGVVPEYRGRGLGRVLIAEAKRQLAALGRKRLVLAVDVRNWPALCAYEKAGFTSFARADVYQRLLVRS
ncbi:MAG: GNAT family N-acetyltransferase [Thermoguttaceae bacterium]|nr:GNAT family N-acetyltransferase [Thermoguttaceae bacterium]